MNVFVLFLSTPLLKLICRVVFFATFFLPVSMTVWPALPDVEVRDREEIQHGRDILLVSCCIISQEVSTRAVDDANVPMHQACSALWFRLHVDYLAYFSIPSSCNRIFWFVAERIECSMLLKITLKCLSLRWFSICWIKLWTLMPCDRFTIAFGTPEMLKSMFSSSIARLNLFAFDDAVSRWSWEPNSCTVCLCLIPRVSPFYREHAWRDCLHTSRVSPFYLKSQVLCANVYQQSLVNGRLPFLHKNTFRLHGFPRSITGWIGLGLGWFGRFSTKCFSQKTVERSFQLAVVQL